MPVPAYPPEEELIAKAREQFREGKIAFKPPEEMTSGKTETLEARITYLEQNGPLVEGMRGRGQPIVESLKVSCRMKVTLLAANNIFDITPLTPQEVRLLDPQEPYSSWKWSVTPKKSGTHEIHLTAEAPAELPELGEKSLYVKTFDYTIKVKVTKESVLDWVGQYWQYILGSIFIPLAGWFWNLYSKRREKNEGKPTRTTKNYYALKSRANRKRRYSGSILQRAVWLLNVSTRVHLPGIFGRAWPVS
jgi:hypothetical protein